MNIKLINKLKQLLAMASSKNNASKNETEIAQAKAEQLMRDHNIHMSDLDAKSNKAVRLGVCSKPNIPSWDYRIFAILSILFEVDYCWCDLKDSKTMSFIGLQENVELAKRTYTILYDICIAKVERAYMIKNKDAYLDGLTTGLLRKAYRYVEPFKDPMNKPDSITVSKKSEIEEWDKQLKVKRVQREEPDRSHSPEFMAGFLDGETINLDFKGVLE